MRFRSFFYSFFPHLTHCRLVETYRAVIPKPKMPALRCCTRGKREQRLRPQQAKKHERTHQQDHCRRVNQRGDEGTKSSPRKRPKGQGPRRLNNSPAQTEYKNGTPNSRPVATQAINAHLASFDHSEQHHDTGCTHLSSP